MTIGQIKIYGTSWCGQTARARSLFSQKSVPYEWIDIERDPAAAAYVEKVNRGFRSVPTILFPDGSILVEPGNAELEKKLDSFLVPNQ